MVQRDKRIRFTVDISRRAFAWGVAAVLVVAFATKLLADTMTMTTYYPSPTGIYQRLTTTARTILARDGGGVGIGTTEPQAMLDVAGPMRPGVLARDPATGAEGAFYYNSDAKNYRMRSGSSWKPIVGPDYDSGWVQSADTFTDVIRHGLHAYPKRVTVWFSPTNPPSGRIYDFSQAWPTGWYFSTDYNADEVRIFHYYYKYIGINLTPAVWGWDWFLQGYYRVLVWT